MPIQCSLPVIDVDDPIDADGLRILEALLGAPIPEELAALYTESAGGWFPVGAEFETDDGEPVFLDHFHALHLNQISLEVLKEAGYEVLVPFGGTPIGDVLTVSIDEDSKGMVYEWLHDEPDDNLRFVSSSLYRFLMSGQIKTSDIPLDAPAWFRPVIVGDLEALSGLIGSTFNIEAVDDAGETMLMLAVWQRQLPAVKWLLEKGANVNSVNLRGDSVLHLAVSGHSPNCVAACLEVGANTETLNGVGYTPLLHAISIGGARAARELVKHGANIHFRAADGADIFSLADIRNTEEFVQTLRDATP